MIFAADGTSVGGKAFLFSGKSFCFVLRGSAALEFFELALKITLGGKGKIVGNIGEGFVGTY